MIGMMYLVLTAMLALNVSKDILDAFVVVNDAMVETNTNFESKVNQSYALFDKAEESEPAKAKPFNDKAKQIRKIANEMADYIANVKYEMHAMVDGITLEQAQTMSLHELEGKDNYTKPSQYFMGQSENGKAFEMHQKIIEFKDQIRKIIENPDYEIKGLNTEGPFFNANKEKESWEKHNFDHIVAAASYTLLNKMIGEIKNIEFEVVNHLFSAIDAGSMKFDNVTAQVVPNSKIVFSGGAYEADIFVAAYDSRQNPTVYWKMGRDSVSQSELASLEKIEGENGKVILKIPTSGVGDQKFAGMIAIQGPDGMEYRHFKSSYSVTRPSAAIAADKMNVLYADIPNPVSIAAPVAPERLRISWGGASATSKGAGTYDVSVPSSMAGRDITISVAADLDGRSQTMGSAVFRVKRVPEPTIFLGANIQGGRQPKDLILANPLVTAQMSSDFNFQLRWNVLSYKVTFVRNGIEDTPVTVNGPRFPEQIISKIRSAPSGTLIEITDISIRSEAGSRNIQKTLSVRIR
jgi:gliding motility-associated protein GldM